MLSFKSKKTMKKIYFYRTSEPQKPFFSAADLYPYG